MMPHLAHHIASERIAEAHRRAAGHRLRREAKRAAEQSHGLIDVVGHGLIALGSRMVSHHDDPAPRQAA